ncbi:MAG TPA: DUF1592 domain-containing protein [Verrucomicrobiae bacterium]|nr:DUF1592 domain-containing protein [Verrucomicrobiae bacterium]
MTQYENAIADLVGSFRKPVALDEKHGLNAEYFNSRNLNNKKAFDRIDSKIQFNFGEAAPDPDTNKISPQEFSIRWTGSIIAEETGDYEFCLKTENGARLWLNTAARRRRMDGPKATIDGWVSSGSTVREERATVRLLGGRAYPIQVDFFKFKDKTASLTLEWKPPHKAWETIPARNLVPVRVPETMVITTAFPPDDSSVGYERGTAVSKEWDQATTHAAIEVAGRITSEIAALSGCRPDQPDYGDCLQQFCRKFIERAFRRPLTDDEARHYVQKHFDDAAEPEAALKRVLLLALKSPRFLYTEALGGTEEYGIASRLSFALWDSIPDDHLLTAAKEGKLRTPQQIDAQAQRMLTEPRARGKVRDFFRHWLEMERATEMSKDKSTFPDFTENALGDLRTSLEMFIDDVVWSPKSDYRQLLLADYLYLNGPLAKLYGADLPPDSDFQKVKFDSKLRTGVITHPYLLSVFAYHKSSSPIHRGVFLTRNIVGRALKPPPMAIQFMDDRFDPSLTMREKVSELTRPAKCQGCHSVINPLGFSLEHYDAVGRFRTKDNQKPVDSTGEYTTSDGKTVRLTGPRDVAEYAARSKDAQAAFIQQLFHHMVKQPAAAYGPDTLERLRRSFAKSDYNIQQLILEIVKTSALHHENS